MLFSFLKINNRVIEALLGVKIVVELVVLYDITKGSCPSGQCVATFKTNQLAAISAMCMQACFPFSSYLFCGELHSRPKVDL